MHNKIKCRNQEEPKAFILSLFQSVADLLGLQQTKGAKEVSGTLWLVGTFWWAGMFWVARMSFQSCCFGRPQLEGTYTGKNIIK